MPKNRSKLQLFAFNTFFQTYHYLIKTTCTFLPSERLIEVLKSPEPVIFATFHQDALTTYPCLLKFGNNRRFCSITSLSRDGELAAYLMEHLGIHVVRGSSSCEGTKGFFEIVRRVREKGESVIFTCDGPRRPFGQVEPGVVMLASFAGIPVYVLRTQANYQAVLEKSPPKYFFPRPFSKIATWEIGPIQIKRGCSKKALKQYQEEVQDNFDKLIQQAQNYPG